MTDVSKPYEQVELKYPDKDLRILRLRNGRPGDTITVEVLRMDPYNDVPGSGQQQGPNFPKFPYEALSWCWGQDSTQSQTITVVDNSKDDSKHENKTYSMEISPSLADALESLRYPDRARDLWIDSICIDQDKVEERNIQVGRMANVYGDATNVCIWLGTGDDSSKAALDFIRKHVLQLRRFDQVTDKDHLPQWDHFIRLMKRPWFSRRWVVQEIALATKATVHCGFDYVDWRDFADAVALLDSVQSAGRKLSDAAKKQPFEEYVARSFEEVSKLEAVKLVGTVHALFRTSPSMREPLATLENLVCRLSSFEVTEPRDAVFSLLAIAKDVNPQRGDIMPKHIDTEELKRRWAIVKARKELFRSKDSEDYLISYEAKVLDVYAQLVEFIVRKADKTRALDIICRPWATPFFAKNAHPVTRSPGSDADNKQDTTQQKSTSSIAGRWEPASRMPSWIVSVDKGPFHKVRDGTSARTEGRVYQTWTVKRQNADGLVGYPDDHLRNYSAAGTIGLRHQTFEIVKRESHHSMFVEGLVLDSLDIVEAVSQLGNIPGDWLKYARWEAREDDRDYPPDPGAWATFWKTLVADRDQTGRNAPPFFDRACEMVIRSEPGNNTIDTNTLMNHGFGKDKSEVVTGFLGRVQQVIWNRHMVQTQTGRLGLAPNGAKREDLVCVLYGCSVPVVLRRHLNEHPEEDEAYDEGERKRKAFLTMRKKTQRRAELRKAKTVASSTPGMTSGDGSARVAAMNHEDQSLPNGVLCAITLSALVFSGDAYYRNIPCVAMMWWLAMVIRATRVARELGPKSIVQHLLLRSADRLIVSGAMLSSASLVLYFVCLQSPLAIATCVLSGAVDLCPREVTNFRKQICVRFGIAGDDNTTEQRSTPESAETDIKAGQASSGTQTTAPSGGSAPKYWYELIGEAYVHNMMNGEAIGWQNDDLANRRPIVFEIR